MSDFDAALYLKLTNDAGVSAILGTRVYPSYDRQIDRVYPLAVYKLNVSPIPAFDGPSGVEQGTATIAAVATTDPGAKALADAIQAALDQQPGTWAGVVVQGMFLQPDGVRDDVVTEPSTEAILYYVKELTFDVTFED